MREVRLARPDQLTEIAAFVSSLQADPRHYIAHLEVSAESIEQYLQELPGGLWYKRTFLAYEDEQLVGSLFYNYNPSRHHRLWLNGPFSTHTDAEGWQQIADTLYGLIPNAPTGIEHELFADIANTNIAEFAARHGFKMLVPAASLVLKRDGWLRGKDYAPSIGSVRPFDSTFTEQLRQLHLQVFPDTYARLEQLIQDHLAGKRTIFIETTDTQLQGYLVVKIDEAAAALIEFLAVAPTARRLGIGRQLITRALQWGFEHPTVPRVHLTVNRENDAAIELYVSLGFTHERTLVAYRKRFG
jgi:ribosomal protein S18 acetylase RimI-like enzyme